MNSYAEENALARIMDMPTDDDVVDAQAYVSSFLEPTPLIAAPTLGPNTWLKLELEQPTGSFKVRGAVNAVARAPAGNVLLTASAGNHGLGVAYAAAELAREAVVVVPETASRAKVEALQRYPVELRRHGGTYDEAESHALALATADGAHYVSPYNDRHVIAGQATIAYELLDALTGPATIVCPIGGGGLISGIGLAFGRNPDVSVIGVESAGSAAMGAALRFGRIVRIAVKPSLADGLGGNLEAGSITFDLVQRYVDDVVTVNEREIALAIRFLNREHDLVVEGAGAVAAAALLSGRIHSQRQVIALVTGRNIVASEFARITG